eukprot:tig00001292_g8054.t1
MAGSRPALFEAVVAGQTDAVKSILERGQAPVNTQVSPSQTWRFPMLTRPLQDKYGRSALFKAVEGGNAPLVRFLLEQGAPVDVRAVNGFTPLIAACVLRRADICAELLRFGADVRTQDNEGKSALVYAAHIPEIRDMLLCRAARDGFTDAVKELMRLGANLNASDTEGWTPLIGACAGGHYPVLRELLARSDELRSSAHRFGGGGGGWAGGAGSAPPSSLSGMPPSSKDNLKRKPVDATLELYRQSPEKGIYLEARDVQGRTALIHSAIGGFFDITKELVERGAEVMSVDASGKTGLLHAAEGMHIPLVRYLMEQSEGHLEVCGEGGEGLLRALAQCRESLPFEKCSRHRVRAVLLFSKLFREQASADKFHAAKLNGLANACVDLATQLYDTYVEEFAKKLLAHELEGQSVLDLALDARAARFIGHPYVQQYVDDLWTGRVDEAEAEAEERGSPRRRRGWWQRFKRRIAPRTKLYMEMTSYFVYLLIFSIVVERRAMELTALECVMYFYVATMALEEQRQLWSEGWRAYFSSFWNLLDQAIFNISGASAVLRLVAMAVPGAADDTRLANFAYDILGCSALLLWIRLLNICTFNRRLGEMLMQIRGMFADFTTFSAIMVLVMVGFSQSLHVLGADRVHGGGSSVFFLPAIVDMFRAVLGDFDFDGVGARSPFLGRLFLSGFLITCNILLMNLLIATFSNTLTTVSLNSRDDLLFNLTERVLDYRASAFRLPPPFNVFDLAGTALRALAARPPPARRAPPRAPPPPPPPSSPPR